MIITNTSTYNTNFQGITKRQMEVWKYLNGIPKYTNASYAGYTGMKKSEFPIGNRFTRTAYPDITEKLNLFETQILQELKSCKDKKFGYIRALWKMCQNFGTGAPWDTKFLPNFPGRNKKGLKQYAIYKDEIVSACDISNLIFGHACKFMGIPTKLAQLIARLDAKGFLELFSKGKLPNLKLLQFKDPQSDQLAIAKGIREFNINDYNLK